MTGRSIVSALRQMRYFILRRICRTLSLAKIQKMLQVAFIRQNVDFVKERLAVRNFTETALIDNIVSLDDQRKKLQLESDTTQSRINALSKEIGGLMAKGK